MDDKIVQGLYCCDVCNTVWHAWRTVGKLRWEKLSDFPRYGLERLTCPECREGKKVNGVNKCHICGKHYEVDDMEICPVCRKPTCYMCYDYDGNRCNKCIEKKEEDKHDEPS